MRPSSFPAPYFNRNRSLVSELRLMLDRQYEGQEILEVREVRGRRVFYKTPVHHFHSELVSEWLGECTLIDEPHSPGQAGVNLTDIRNDFVIIRFNRRLETACVEADGTNLDSYNPLYTN